MVMMVGMVIKWYCSINTLGSYIQHRELGADTLQCLLVPSHTLGRFS